MSNCTKLHENSCNSSETLTLFFLALLFTTMYVVSYIFPPCCPIKQVVLETKQDLMSEDCKEYKQILNKSDQVD